MISVGIRMCVLDHQLDLVCRGGWGKKCDFAQCPVFLFVQGILGAAFIDGMVGKVEPAPVGTCLRVIVIQIIAEDFSDRHEEMKRQLATGWTLYKQTSNLPACQHRHPVKEPDNITSTRLISGLDRAAAKNEESRTD